MPKQAVRTTRQSHPTAGVISRSLQANRRQKTPPSPLHDVRPDTTNHREP